MSVKRYLSLWTIVTGLSCNNNNVNQSNTGAAILPEKAKKDSLTYPNANNNHIIGVLKLVTPLFNKFLVQFFVIWKIRQDPVALIATVKNNFATSTCVSLSQATKTFSTSAVPGSVNTARVAPNVLPVATSNGHRVLIESNWGVRTRI